DPLHRGDGPGGRAIDPGWLRRARRAGPARSGAREPELSRPRRRGSEPGGSDLRGPLRPLLLGRRGSAPPRGGRSGGSERGSRRLRGRGGPSEGNRRGASQGPGTRSGIIAGTVPPAGSTRFQRILFHGRPAGELLSLLPGETLEARPFDAGAWRLSEG